MRSLDRLDRLRRRRTRLREQATADLARHMTDVTGLEHEMASVRESEDAIRRGATTAGATGAAFALAWTYADGLARRATALCDDRMRTVASADAARAAVRERRHDEQQLVRLAALACERIDARVERQRERRLDELALWAHGRKR